MPRAYPKSMLSLQAASGSCHHYGLVRQEQSMACCTHVKLLSYSILWIAFHHSVLSNSKPAAGNISQVGETAKAGERRWSDSTCFLRNGDQQQTDVSPIYMSESGLVFRLTFYKGSPSSPLFLEEQKKISVHSPPRLFSHLWCQLTYSRVKL